MPALPARLRRPLPWVLLVLAALLVHLGEFLGGRPYWRDMHLANVPTKFFLWKSLHEGVLPQWYPWDSAGMPFLSQPIFSVFHPTTLLLRVLPFWPALTLQIFCGTLLALTGTYALARELRQPVVAALLAAPLFGVSGYVTSLYEQPFMALAAGTIPWYLWALARAQRRGGAWLVVPGLVLGSLLLAGDPQAAMLASIAGALLLLARPGPRVRAALLAVGSPLVGGLLAAIQLGPSLLLVGDTERTGGIAAANKWTLGLQQLGGLVLPIDHGAFYFVPSTLIGLAGLSLAAASLVRLRKRPTVAALWAMAILGLWLALGDQFGLNLAARHVLPFWSKLRYPVKSVELATLAFALLAGEGFAQLGSGRRGLLARRFALVGALIWLAIGAIALSWGAPLPGLFALLLTGAAAVAVLGLGVLRERPILRQVAVAAVATQLLAAAIPIIRLAPSDFYDEPPMARALKAVGVGLFGPAYDRVELEARPTEEEPAASVAGAGGHATSLGALWDLPSITTYLPGSSRRVRALFTDAPLSIERTRRFAGIFGVAYVVENGFIARQEAASIPILATEPRFDWALVGSRRSLARAYAVHRARPMADLKSAVDEIYSDRFKPGREVLVETTTPNPAWAQRPDELSVPASVVERTNASVTVEAQLPWPGFVVLNEAVTNGWTAQVDGVDAPIFPANAAVRAVEVPPGPHRIVFRYRAPGLVAGATVSGVTLALLLVAALVLHRRTRRVA